MSDKDPATDSTHHARVITDRLGLSDTVTWSLTRETLPAQVRTLRICRPTESGGAWTVEAWDEDGDLVDLGVGTDREDVLLEIIAGPGFDLRT